MSKVSPSRFRPNGLVTLITDFGLSDPYVGIMKGVLYRDAPGLTNVIDLSHDVPPQDVEAAAFFLEHAWPWFPSGTVHVCVVDPGVGSERPILLAEAAGHVFLAPDNGLLAPLLRSLGTDREARLYRLDLEHPRFEKRSTTFHGRDVFAPAAGALATGTAPKELGRETRDFVAPKGETLRGPVRGRSGWSGRVRWIDRFGNAVTDLEADLLPAGSEGTLMIQGRELALVQTYSELEPGEPLALVSSYGLLEIAVRDGSAAEALGLRRGAEVQLIVKDEPRSKHEPHES